MRSLCRALLLLPVIGASASHGATLPFSGTLSVEISGLPSAVVSASALATLNGSGGLGALSSLGLQAGAFAGYGSIPMTDPENMPIQGLRYALANGPGSFAPGGAMAVQGHALICLFAACNASPVGNLEIPFTQSGTRGVGLGGPAIVAPGVVNFTIQGAPWSVGPVSSKGMTRVGFIHGPASGGASSAAAVSGAIRLVTPIALTTNIGTDPLIPAFGILELRFVPEPTTLALVVSGITGLALRGRSRLRRSRDGGARARRQSALPPHCECPSRPTSWSTPPGTR